MYAFSAVSISSNQLTLTLAIVSVVARVKTLSTSSSIVIGVPRIPFTLIDKHGYTSIYVAH